MKILVTGGCGQLGQDVLRELSKRGHQCVCGDIFPDSPQDSVQGIPYLPFDITSRETVSAAMEALKPDAVIHCAAWTAVDLAEDKREQAYALNAAGTENVAEACAAVGAKMMYISTDYVFDGSGSAPWGTESEAFFPVNYYGLTKLEGEKAVRRLTKNRFIVRISWVFGLHGTNFVKTMLRLGETHDSLRVVNDQIGAPTYTVDLAGLLSDLIVTDQYGTYHAANTGGYISWADFAREIFRQAGMGTRVIEVSTEEYGSAKANRPRNSRLDLSGLAERGFSPLPPWQDALTRFLRENGSLPNPHSAE